MDQLIISAMHKCRETITLPSIIGEYQLGALARKIYFLVSQRLLWLRLIIRKDVRELINFTCVVEMNLVENNNIIIILILNFVNQLVIIWILRRHTYWAQFKHINPRVLFIIRVNIYSMHKLKGIQSVNLYTPIFTSRSFSDRNSHQSVVEHRYSFDNLLRRY